MFVTKWGIKLNKVILGLDLSLACPAFSIVEINSETNQAKVIEVSHVKTSSKKCLGYRLFQIANHLQSVLDNHPEIEEVVMEKGFNRFAKATQQIQRVVGVVIITLYRNNVYDVGEIAPTSVKKYITKDGKASKDLVAEKLHNIVGFIDYQTDDESDAVGVAIAWAVSKNWFKVEA